MGLFSMPNSRQLSDNFQGFRVYPKSTYCPLRSELGEHLDIDAKSVFAVNPKALDNFPIP
jgi:hypothetical protein